MEKCFHPWVTAPRRAGSCQDSTEELPLVSWLWLNRLTEDANTGELTLCPLDAALRRAGPTPRLGIAVELWYWYWCREVSPEAELRES